MKTILIISTLNTKAAETFYLSDMISRLGGSPVVLDISMRPMDGEAWADIPPDEVARAAGSTMMEILASGERAKNTAIMTRGAAVKALQMLAESKLDGVVGIGGSTGSLMATDVMRSLPFGLPKLMVSSTAALPGMSTKYIGTGDIALMHSVVEIAGLGDALRNVIERAARGICAMAEAAPIVSRKNSGDSKAVAITMLGPCDRCATAVRLALEEKGHHVTGFSAAGISDRAMELMVSQGLFDAVIDLAPGGVMEHLVGGMRDAGPSRMEAAGKAGIPQVISTCGVNHITPPKSKYTEDHKKRRKYDIDRFRTWLRASPDELRAAARAFAEKLNGAGGPVKVIIPMKGWSSVDVPGSATYDPEEDRCFLNEFRRHAAARIEIAEIDANMEDPVFARSVISAGMDILGRSGRGLKCA